MADKPDDSEKLTKVIATDGVHTLPISNEDDSTNIGHYWNAVKSYLNTGDSMELKMFEGASVMVGDKTYYFDTDLEDIEELYDAGELSFEDIYEFIY